jgi:hypothetical protein
MALPTTISVCIGFIARKGFKSGGAKSARRLNIGVSDQLRPSIREKGVFTVSESWTV